MEEKRQFHRFDSERRFIAKYENQDRILGEIRDFSRSGMSFSSKDQLNSEDQIRLDLEISGLQEAIPASIRILWSKQEIDGYTYGARLINISPESKFEIMDLLYQDWKKAVKDN